MNKYIFILDFVLPTVVFPALGYEAAKFCSTINSPYLQGIPADELTFCSVIALGAATVAVNALRTSLDYTSSSSTRIDNLTSELK